MTLITIILNPLNVLNILSRAGDAEEGVPLSDTLKRHIVVLEHISRLDISVVPGNEMSPRTKLGWNRRQLSAAHHGYLKVG